MSENSDDANPTAPPTDDTTDQSEESDEGFDLSQPINGGSDQSDQSEDTNDDADQSESTNEFDNHSVPSYLLGYGSTFVYNQPQANPALNQASNYAETSNGQSESSYPDSQSEIVNVDSGSGDSEGSGGSFYQPTPQTQQQNTPPKVASLSCWRCENALTWAECASSGHLERCEESADSCQLTVRKRDGNYESITTGCKQKEACENNKRNV